ncbi:trypsin-related protease [Fusarium albosuccineum]|uniref:Trypsin-related protease n=1 Tax=Fusarium albosuccineum TaxID=1237068 RepID=A0A8H4LA76_9HYPO|nr:trypsin-related protease [Fusarium albosuccineum]
MALMFALALVLALSVLSKAVPTEPVSISLKAPAIVGGQDARLGDFPYLVSLLQYGSAWCGGSLLDSRTVLTAAHCVAGRNASDFQVRAGSLNWDAGGQKVNVSFFNVHPSYNSSNADNDIAIVRLASPIEDTAVIGYATLPKHCSDPVPNSTATTAGWGDLEFGGPATRELKKVSVSVVSRQRCQKQYLKNNPPLFVTDNMVCAGSDKGGKDACNGDSGGPIIDVETGVLIGIASWGIECALADFPGVYTRVGNYLPYILSYLTTPSS